MAIGTTNDHNVTRDQLIIDAHVDVGALDPFQTIEPKHLQQGIRKLNNIIREIDARGKHLWAISQTPSNITLVANTFLYTTSNGLQSNILRLATASYRDGSANDYPLEIIRNEDYEAIPDKFTTGEPKKVYLTEHETVSSKTLKIYPARNEVDTQSTVVGSDGLDYPCIKTHEAATANKPITGDDYLLYWGATSGSGSGSAWTSGTTYNNPQLIRYTYRRPLYDFDNSTDNPDLPQQWIRHLHYRLCVDLSPGFSVPRKKLANFMLQAGIAYENIRGSFLPKATNIHNKSRFF